MASNLLDPQLIGKTFDDFLFRPQKGITSTRAGIPLRSRLTQHIALDLPIVSSNMDSVTGGDMAETMALEGGLGVIHRGQTLSASVKRSVASNEVTVQSLNNPERCRWGQQLKRLDCLHDAIR